MDTTQKKIEIMQKLCDYFEIDLDDYGGEVTEENYREILGDYSFQSGASLGYG